MFKHLKIKKMPIIKAMSIPELYRPLLESFKPSFSIKCETTSRGSLLNLDLQHTFPSGPKFLAYETIKDLWGPQAFENDFQLPDDRFLVHQIVTGNISRDNINRRSEFINKIQFNPKLHTILDHYQLPANTGVLFPELITQLSKAPDTSLYRIVAYTSSMAITPQQKEVGRQIAARYIQKQLESQLVGISLLDILDTGLSFVDRPRRLQWICVNINQCNQCNLKTYRFIYPNTYKLDSGTQDHIKTVLLGELAVSRIGNELLQIWSLPHTEVIAKTGTESYFRKLLNTKTLSNIISLRPENRADALAGEILQQDIRDALFCRALRVLSIASASKDLDKITSLLKDYVEKDSKGCLTTFIHGLDTNNVMDYTKLTSALRLRINSRPDLQDILTQLLAKQP